MTWRLPRPDVLAYYAHYGPISAPNWGYNASVLNVPLGANVIALVFTDPAIGIAASIQQVSVVVVP